MNYLTVPNLDLHQHYKDRRPPWMKLHATLLQDYEFSTLTDAEKYQIIALWLLATQLDNKLPDNEDWLKAKIQASKINLSKFKALHMLEQHASNTLAPCKRDAIAETYKEETYKEEKHLCNEVARERKKKEKIPFDKFYSNYPKKVDKQKCSLKWNNLTKSDQLKAIAGIKPFVAGKEKQYIASPTVYLNGKRWEDEPDGSVLGKTKGWS